MRIVEFVCVALAACRAPAPANLLTLPDASVIPPNQAGVPWSRSLCETKAEEPFVGEPSSLTVSGECNFEQREPFHCRAMDDDFYTVSRRPLLGDNRLVTLYMNVEHFHGPGTYDENEVNYWIGEGANLYRWTNKRGSVTLEADPTAIASDKDSGGVRGWDLPETVLQAEPGTMTTGTITIGGRISCRKFGEQSVKLLAP